MAVNAQDAMPEGGALRIATTRIDLSPAEAAQLGQGNPEQDRVAGAYAVLKVSDTGHGIPPAVRNRVFEPFFSTRVSGQSTGLGLSTVYGIVAQHDGHITLESEEGLGTTFSVFIPLIDEYRPASAAIPAPDHAGLLIVTEDALILQMLAVGLRSMTRRVMEALTVADAERIAVQHGRDIGVAVLDAALESLHGTTAHAVFDRLFPAASLVFFSSHPREFLEARGRLRADDVFLPRPFTLAQAADQVRIAFERGY
jgi:hypothetical protein